jgi:hypothetical protein
MKVFLFDVDSVLLNPLGYRYGIPAAIHHYTRQWGWGDVGPTEEQIEAMEAHGISSEWDSIACILARLLCLALPDTTHPFPANLASTHQFLLAQPQPAPKFDIVAWIGAVMQATQPGEAPAIAALRLLTAQTPSSFHPLLQDLLGDTRNVWQSELTRVFQQLMLGDALFSTTYRLPATLHSTSFLTQYDQTLLSPANAHWLRNAYSLATADTPAVAVYTARPCLPPIDANADPLGYSPEAELALQLVGLDGVPLVGYGCVQWLAQQVGGNAEQYGKPQVVQALGALGAALSGKIATSLQSAFELVCNGKLLSPFAEWVGHPLQIFIFEDSARSIRGVQQMGALLREHGIDAQVFGMGIDPYGPKQPVLQAVGAKVFADVNQAILWARQES